MNGEGEVVSGIALQRFGENALEVIRNVKDRLAEIAPSLPRGVTIDSVYDRSDLIYRAIDTLKRTLLEESFIVALVCLIFLLHVRSALVAILTLPLGVLIAYVCMNFLGLSSNIMSLGGIAIANGPIVRDSRLGAPCIARTRPLRVAVTQPPRLRADTAVATSHQCGASVQAPRDTRRPHVCCCEYLTGDAAPHRAHAVPQRGYAVLY